MYHMKGTINGISVVVMIAMLRWNKRSISESVYDALLIWIWRKWEGILFYSVSFILSLTTIPLKKSRNSRSTRKRCRTRIRFSRKSGRLWDWYAAYVARIRIEAKWGHNARPLAVSIFGAQFGVSSSGTQIKHLNNATFLKLDANKSMSTFLLRDFWCWRFEVRGLKPFTWGLWSEGRCVLIKPDCLTAPCKRQYQARATYARMLLPWLSVDFAICGLYFIKITLSRFGRLLRCYVDRLRILNSPVEVYTGK